MGGGNETPNMKKITLAVCTNRGVKPKTVGSLLDLVAHTQGADFHILVAERGYTISENRNYCVVQAQKNKSDYLFFVDDDMVFPADTLTRLLAGNKEVVGVNSYSRCLPLSSTVGLMNDKGEYMHPDKHTKWEMKVPGKLFKAYFVGAGVLLIDMKVFGMIKSPFFEFTYDKNGQVVNGEDGTFCKKIQEAGMDVWCDGSISIGHIGEYTYSRPDEPDDIVSATFAPSGESANDLMVGSALSSEGITKTL